tara:strand:+ start:715 stop:978 length:264 start_codon:yes stop_codon:yes gene_type:complete
MSRPKPLILLNKQLANGGEVEILAAESMYMVVYKNKAFNLRNKYWRDLAPAFVYKKLTFPSPAPAVNLAKKLNQMFFTSDFTVRQII